MHPPQLKPALRWDITFQFNSMHENLAVLNNYILNHNVLYKIPHCNEQPRGRNRFELVGRITSRVGLQHRNAESCIIDTLTITND